MRGILKRKSTDDYERSVFHHIRYEYSRCTSRIVCALNTIGFYSVIMTYSSSEYSRIFRLSRNVKNDHRSKFSNLNIWKEESFHCDGHS